MLTTLYAAPWLQADVAAAVSEAANMMGMELSSQQLKVEGVANEQWVDQIKVCLRGGAVGDVTATYMALDDLRC
jgi:hypothetical protein